MFALLCYFVLGQNTCGMRHMKRYLAVYVIITIQICVATSLAQSSDTIKAKKQAAFLTSIKEKAMAGSPEAQIQLASVYENVRFLSGLPRRTRHD